MNKKYKILIFDMDGTIAYTDEMIIHTFSDLYDMYNPSAKKSREELLYFSGPPLKVTLPQEFPNLDFDFIHNEFIRISTPYYEKYVELFPFELETFKALKDKGYLLAVVTNKGHEKAQYVLDKLGLNEYISILIGGGDVSEMKPHPEGINKVLETFNIKKEEALYIGDNDIDYLTASNAGVDSMICSWGPRKLNVLDKATYVVDSYLSIKEILC